MEEHLSQLNARATGWPMAAAKATAVSLLLGGIFFLLPGTWNWRLTLAVCAVFWVNTFLFSLLSSWLAKKVRAHFEKQP